MGVRPNPVQAGQRKGAFTLNGARPMPCRFLLEPCTEDFFDRPPHSWVFERVLQGSCEEVFAAIVEPGLEREWFPNFVSSTWHGERGPGADREYRLTYMRMVERFVEYDPARRMRFYLTSCSLPLLRRFGETWTLDPAGPRRTQLRWKIAYEPHPMLRWAHAPLRQLFGADFEKALTGLERFLAREPSRSARRDRPGIAL